MQVGALKPSAEVEEQLKALSKECTAAFDASAKSLLPTGVRWTTAYERTAVVDAMQESARAHIETLQVQGLYLPMTGHKLPIDFSAHWLGLRPFGRDSRYDPVTVKDEPRYRPHASPMKFKATKGYKPKTQMEDPDTMVFSDKMMQ